MRASVLAKGGGVARWRPWQTPQKLRGLKTFIILKGGKGGGPRSGARGRGLRRGAEVAFLEFYDAVGFFAAVREGSRGCGGHCLASMSVSILIGGGGVRGNENARSKHSARGSKIKLVSIQSVISAPVL